MQIIFFSYKEKCPANTQSWLHKMKFWSGYNQKKVNELYIFKITQLLPIMIGTIALCFCAAHSFFQN